MFGLQLESITNTSHQEHIPQKRPTTIDELQALESRSLYSVVWATYLPHTYALPASETATDTCSAVQTCRKEGTRLSFIYTG